MKEEKKELITIETYKNVFTNIAKDYIEDWNCNLELNKKELNVSKEDLQLMGEKLYDNDYLWEVIDEIMYNLLQQYLEETE